MNEIILNESAAAEEALSENKIGINPVSTVNRVARYYYEQGFKKDEIRSLVEAFITKSIPSVNILGWRKSVRYAVDMCDKYPLINIPYVPITESEMKKIGSLNGSIPQRVAFTLVCVAKYYNIMNEKNGNWVNRDIGYIFSLANVKISSARQMSYINMLWKNGYVGLSKIVDNVNLNVAIVDNDSPVVHKITDFRNLGNQYLAINGEPFVKCQMCGITIKKTSNAVKYCKRCADSLVYSNGRNSA